MKERLIDGGTRENTVSHNFHPIVKFSQHVFPLLVVYGIAGIGDKAVKAQSSNIEESRRPYCESKFQLQSSDSLVRSNSTIST
jgi:hypothetical protein